MTTLSLDSAPAVQVEDGSLDHVTCCMDDNLALCGTDVTEDEWVAPDSPITCVVCHALEEAVLQAGSCVAACPRLAAVVR